MDWRRSGLAAVAGIALITLGTIVMAGWWLRVPAMVQILPGYIAMAFNTAACFFAGGVALLLPPKLQRHGQRFIGAAIMILASAVLVQMLLPQGYGIDWPHLHDWLKDPNPHPGRMAPNTSLAFMFGGAVLMLLQVQRRWAYALVQALTFLVLLIGLLSFIGYTLKLDLLYRWYQYTRMAVHTALGFIVFGIGLASTWYRAPWFANFYRGHEDLKIGALAAAILIVAAFTSGLLSFVTLEQHSENALTNSLQLSLSNRLDLLQTSIEQATSNARFAARRASLLAQLRRLNMQPRDQGAQAELERIVRSLIADRFSAILIRTQSGGVVSSAGRFVESSIATLPLKPPYRARLMWRDGAYLHMELSLSDAHGPLGVMITEQALPMVARLMRDVQSLGATAESGICTAIATDTLECLPTKLHPSQFRYILREASDRELPMARALNGDRGVGITHDYRGQKVLAAFSPVGDLGLALVIKMDTAELYAPIRERLQHVLPLLFVLVIGGVALVRWQMLPVVRKLQASEHAATERATALGRLAAIIESSGDAIIGTNLDGTVATWNPAAQRMYGYRSDEIIGQPMACLIPPHDRAAAAALNKRVLSGEPVNFYETLRLSKSGAALEVAVTVSPIRGIGGEIVGLAHIEHDIGERRRAERALAQKTEELARSNRELEQFAYVASHDLQEPLRMISSYTQLLARRYRAKLDDTAIEFMDYVTDGVKRMQTLIQDLLAYSRVGSQGMPFTSVDFNVVLEQVLSDLRLVRQETGAVVTHDPLPALDADAVQVTQLFQNLISNAIKFRNSTVPRIHIGVRREQSAWQFSVADNGIGIEPQYAERIFVIFQRLHTRSEYAGTGIGLAICKKIVERHGGRIWVESQHGAGSVFHFTFPIASRSLHAGDRRPH